MAAGRLCEHLVVNGIPEDDVFIDIDDNPPGRDYRQAIKDTIDRSAVVIVVIGRDWLEATDETGNRRLDSPSDTHRLECSGLKMASRPSS